MLARREHSQRELFQKLSNKGFEREAVELILNEFVENDWQSDKRFADSYFRSRVHAGFGPIRIAVELKERGVEADTFSLHEMSDEPSWNVLLNELHKKKYGAFGPSDMKERIKRTRFFQHKGYTSEMIKRLFNSLSNTS
ncbi:MAG: RecX family transcriptional regulator [Cycloclasticus sp. symbiont of Poecilosclerida sp. M]|nr:MAG: RecX family transcriptional regulator [Cycloclasticus sp. symbiont of Poecilosclerida sp. M]